MKIGIIGGGPIGLTLSLLLKKFNVNNFKLFEKNVTPSSIIKRTSSCTCIRDLNNGDI